MKDLSSNEFKQLIKKHEVNILRRAYRMIVTGNDQCNRNKTSTKNISTGKVKYGREVNTSIKLKMAIKC